MNPSDVVCVAHSASGMYLPLIAERYSPRQMVFLAAVVPRPGVSVVEQFRCDPSMFNPAWVGQNPVEDKVALDFVFHDCPPDSSRLGNVDTADVLRDVRHRGTLSTAPLAPCTIRIHCVCRRPDDHASVATQGRSRVARSRTNSVARRTLPTRLPP
jgi:hypothetical protein